MGRALRRARGLGPQPETGCLEGDLTERLRDRVIMLQGPGGRLLHVFIGESVHSEALAQCGRTE
ncbi:hypothetical protein ACFV5G_17465 [Streptomyces sp. NPDC059766]|uniref:hypothetical protein n=1 Tax=Streptomyces sp. NPDC059766 TaxID=3346940 RepID=UPI0036525C0F